MKKNRFLKSEGGFTIIEVVIVLAIAAAILLIVFLAVPALQRNNRNNQRNNDAARLSAAVTECLSNRNGQVASCMATGANAVPFTPGTDAAQLTGAVGFLNTGACGPTGSTTAAQVCYQLACSADGTGTVGASARQFVVRWQNEPGTIQRCIGS